mmetsp:Transcript_152150/g.283487  ORF Transcript_152150/g.283487 Transcript_152150/m.283487 type:complete len:533 (-) Transcript_152150:310-1908(-)
MASERGSKNVAADEAGGNAKRRRSSEEPVLESPASSTPRAEAASPASMTPQPAASSTPRPAAPTPAIQRADAVFGDDSDSDSLNLDALRAKAQAQRESSSSASDKSSDDEAPLKPQQAAAPQSKPNMGAGSILSALREVGISSEAGSDSEDDAAKKKAVEDDSSSDSDSESSSSTSSSSTSAAPDDQMVPQASEEEEETTDDEITERPEELEARGIQAMRRIHLKRDEILRIWFQLPREEAERAIVGSFVRVTLSKGNVVAEVKECVIADQKYQVLHPKGHQCSLDVVLRCRRATTEKEFKITYVSNQDFSKNEFQNWRQVTYQKTGIELETHIARWAPKVSSIIEARSFTWTEAKVNDLLKRKKSTNRMKELTGEIGSKGILRRIDMRIEEECHKQKAKLKYSLREINKKNVDRQTARDKFALNYTYANEASGQGGLNPFERRACRPITAWDTKISKVVDMPSDSGQEAEKKGDNKAASDKKPEVNGVAKEQAAHDAPAAPAQADRVGHILAAHRNVNQLLASQFGLLGVS